MCSGEKLKILQALVGKLLTLASTRELIEECVEEQRSARQDLREVRAEQHRRQREEAALRYTRLPSFRPTSGPWVSHLIQEPTPTLLSSEVVPLLSTRRRP